MFEPSFVVYDPENLHLFPGDPLGTALDLFGGTSLSIIRVTLPPPSTASAYLLKTQRGDEIGQSVWFYHAGQVWCMRYKINRPRKLGSWITAKAGQQHPESADLDAQLTTLIDHLEAVLMEAGL